MLDEKYLARRWLRRHLKWAKTPEEHPAWAQFLKQRYQVTLNEDGGFRGGYVNNPNPDGRDPKVRFSTAYKNPRFRQKVHNEFEQWKQRLAPRPRPKRSPEDRKAEEDALVQVAQDGKIAQKERLGEDTLNNTYKVVAKLGDKEGQFIFKPSFGATDKLLLEEGVSRARPGIKQDEQHFREEATYRADKLLGEGGVVPPSVARHEDEEETDGSYQQYVDATPLSIGIKDLPKKITSEQLANNPSFQRMQVLDLLMGNEDRHAANVMYYFDGEPNAENLRFVAIDNGLSAADPKDTQEPRDHLYVDAFSTWFDATGIGEEYDANPEMKTVAGPPPEDEWKDIPVSGQQAVERVLSEIPKDLHERIKKVDLGEFVREQLDSGLSPTATKAAAVRLATIQADPSIMGVFLEMTDGKLKEAWQEFQHMSGHMPDRLLKTAGAPEKYKEIQEAVRQGSGRKTRRNKKEHKTAIRNNAALIQHPLIQKIGEKGAKMLLDRGPDHAKPLLEKRKERDGEDYHMTVVRPSEIAQLKKSEIKRLREEEGLKGKEARKKASKLVEEKIQKAMEEVDPDWKARGVGRAIEHGPEGTLDNYSYHVVVDWPGGQDIRKRLGLDPKAIDFHVTLGFKEKDIHDVDKGIDSIPPS